MRFHLFVTAVLVLLVSSFTPISAHFFPNVSSIPSLLNSAKSAWDSFHNLTGCHFGDNRHGLSKLKKYFHYFGYIPDLPSNSTDDFDDALESALRTYQRNFNLEPTGQLDEKTLIQIIRPRCGNPDIVNGTTTMNTGRPIASNSTHLHTVGHYSFFPGTPRWPQNKRDLTYAFLPGNQLQDEVKAVFATAFERWSEVTPLTFTQIDSFSTADIRIGFFSGDHGDGEPFDGALGTLAHAFSPPSGHFHLDAEENWVISGDLITSVVRSAIDLESVAVHEIGHLLGLGHSSFEDAIMFPSITSGTRRVELSRDDIAGVQELYGSNPNYNGSSTTSFQQPETSGASALTLFWGLISALLAVGFLDI